MKSDEDGGAKEDDKFSASVLYVATAIYLAVCALVMGGLAGSQPTFGDAFLLFFKDYGAIVAGLPVLVAVLVALQQLDANRRQHVATIKRSFKDPIDTVDLVKQFSQSIWDRNVEVVITDRHRQERNEYYWILDEDELEKIKNNLSKSALIHSDGLGKMTNHLLHMYSNKSFTDSSVRNYYLTMQLRANILNEIAETDYKNIAQYWS